MIVAYFEAALHEVISALELCPQRRGHGGLRHPKVRANVLHGVALDLPPPKLRPVGAILIYDLRAAKEDEVDAALPARREGFCDVEAEAADVADCVEGFTLVEVGQAACGVLNHEQVVFVCDGHDAVHVAGHGGVMDGDYGAGLGVRLLLR